MKKSIISVIVLVLLVLCGCGVNKDKFVDTWYDFRGYNDSDGKFVVIEDIYEFYSDGKGIHYNINYKEGDIVTKDIEKNDKRNIRWEYNKKTNSIKVKYVIQELKGGMMITDKEEELIYDTTYGKKHDRLCISNIDYFRKKEWTNQYDSLWHE